MKKILLSLVLLCSTTLLFAQETSDFNSQDTLTNRNSGLNELSVGALNLVAFGALDVAYERILNEYSSLGAEVFFLALARDSEDVAEAYRKNFSFTGKYKYYFGDKFARGFYVHGFGMLSSGDYRDEYYENGQYRSRNYDYTDFALGFGVGGKFVARGGFFLDLNTGIGRNLLSENSPTVVGQFNVNLGFRF
ncbi:hypothetical protein ACW6QP_07720 [Salegentibacter sp. HM20]